MKSRKWNIYFRSLGFSLLLISATSCMTGSTLRTARVLEKGQVEISAGLAGTEFGDATQVIIGAYGVSDRIEFEARWEDEFFAVTPRLQILQSEKAHIDGVGFFELGYSPSGGFQYGPGVIIGRRWTSIEPYLSYRFRHFSSIASREKRNQEFQECFSGRSNYHYLKFGSRLYISDLWKKRENNTENRNFRVFLDLEVGPTLFKSSHMSGTIFEWAANLGFNY